MSDNFLIPVISTGCILESSIMVGDNLIILSNDFVVETVCTVVGSLNCMTDYGISTISCINCEGGVIVGLNKFFEGLFVGYQNILVAVNNGKIFYWYNGLLLCRPYELWVIPALERVDTNTLQPVLYMDANRQIRKGVKMSKADVLRQLL